MDIAAVDAGLNRVTIYFGNGSGGFTQSAGGPFPTGSSPVAVLAVDLNLDGNMDLVFANQGVNTVTALLGNGAERIRAAAPGSRALQLDSIPKTSLRWWGISAVRGAGGGNVVGLTSHPK